MRALVFALWLGTVVACGHPEPAVPIETSPFIGTWDVTDSTAVWRVQMVGGEVVVDGWDSSNGERFEISGTSVQDGKLRFTSRMPSTDWVVHNTIVIEGGQVLNLRAGAAEVTGAWVRNDSLQAPPE